MDANDTFLVALNTFRETHPDTPYSAIECVVSEVFLQQILNESYEREQLARRERERELMAMGANPELAMFDVPQRAGMISHLYGIPVVLNRDDEAFDVEIRLRERVN